MTIDNPLKPTSTQVLNQNSVLAALERSLAMIEFDPHGKVLWANHNFAQAMGIDPKNYPICIIVNSVLLNSYKVQSIILSG